LVAGTFSILAHGTRVPGSHAQQAQGRTVRPGSARFPVVQCFQSDPEGMGEIDRRQAHKPPDGDDVGARLDPPLRNATTDLG
jgi:hypothetical protein